MSRSETVLLAIGAVFIVAPIAVPTAVRADKPMLVAPAIIEDNRLNAACHKVPSGGYYLEPAGNSCDDIFPPKIWACADKSRTLLHSEDGTGHYCLDVKSLGTAQEEGKSR